MKPLPKNVIISVIVFLALLAIFSTYSLQNNEPKDVSFAAVVEQIQSQSVSSITVEGNKVSVTLQDGTTEVTQKESDASLTELLTQYGISTGELKTANITVKEQGGGAYLLSILLPSLIPILLLVVIFWFMIRQMQGANNRALSFGQSGAREMKDQKQKVTFADVAGAREAKEELLEVVEFLKNPKKFVDMGAKLPKGVLLMGRPGTGKTLMARAIAGEADVPFLHISGSEFVEMFVGVGASRVRDLFQRAKKSAPCIIFVDEIDAVGRQRGTGLGGSHDEREQTLNQILVEMDGFDPHIGVIVIAATNRPDVLDPALLRPGRFDRRVVIDLPDIQERESILHIHAQNKPFAKDVDLRRVAERTPGFSGADLSNLLNEAAIRAAKANQKEIKKEDVLESIEKVLLGPERRSAVLSEEEKKITAYHEAGHALVAHALPYCDPVHKISIISRGSAGGYTLKLPAEDRRLYKRLEFLDDMAAMLGGFLAEKEVFGDVTTGASDDLKKCTRMAREVVTRYGMSEALGPRVFGEAEDMIFLGKEIHENRNYSEKTAELIDSEVEKLVNGAQEKARVILKEQRTMLEKIATTLLEKETIEKEAFEALFQTTT
ncbi:TPA: cell division protein FtsH [Candidatus Uhrbacteria bacterium]|uniref:ATP-dependent zinc metalloprotease FtsH n=2 Tax=Candidatus Uhriibacteriota TaxID=1752732 RepID=A0A0G1Q6R2_9BACT|nr:MAG: ATP-dependent zinc metalloprotease FtsH [Candidatus Uhrbacteria bacterium GW2011_GWF2_46_218]KKU40517.1 MAG: ATP-dependent zinc metalloprotease FtsH [Candidatus Uhrbacteria bacterium GW2011_GWE2_46_68]HBK33608.1 cell division protein FtsH [Candidatus Uhrbacteria bacterium]HCB19002.1 cell division protein FtsH [Candidatus Uhrbacteria bacterium]